jgi:hypothetical protein
VLLQQRKGEKEGTQRVGTDVDHVNTPRFRAKEVGKKGKEGNEPAKAKDESSKRIGRAPKSHVSGGINARRRRSAGAHAVGPQVGPRTQ